MAKKPKFPPAKDRIGPIMTGLAQLYPDAECALVHKNPLQLLVATILSAQCTDKRVNMVTPALFKRYPNAASFSAADTHELEEMIKTTGFFRNKTKSIKACCAAIVEKHGGRVPNTLEELVTLPGVGRKTANVVLGNAFSIPGITVDTHVGRLSRRLGFTKHTDPVKVEVDLMDLIPKESWTSVSHELILHGRNICFARKPLCEKCLLNPHCPKIGVLA
jgi:endonuclease-3